MRLTSYHPGISIEKIEKKTNFELAIAPDVHQTKSPTDSELYLLREEIDPLGIRRLEQLSGATRRKLLRDILIQERINT